MDDPRKFKAFISYRHCPLDMAVAEKLQNLIERYRVPKEYRKNEESALGLVFRDVSELPLSNNLTDDIYTALDNSEYLIVVCTPETPKSLWVSQEIQYFMQIHGRERILIVLADGTPEESLPPMLTHLYDENGTMVGMIEPLCANLVSADETNALKKLNKEFLRLVAAMLGVPYDALYQRRKRYLFQLAAAGASIAMAVMAVILGLLIRWNLDVTQKNEEIAKNLQLALKNESEALTMLSQQQLKEGDRVSALQSALNALPTDENDRPYLAEAEGALAAALNPYGNGALSYHINIKHPASIMLMDLSDDGTKLVTLDALHHVRCFDTQTAALLWQYEIDPSIAGYGNDFLRIIDTQGIVLVHSSYIMYSFSLEDGQILHSLDLSCPEEYAGYSADVSLSDQETLLSICRKVTYSNYQWEIYDVATFSLQESFSGNDAYTRFYEMVPSSTHQQDTYFCATYSDKNNQILVTAEDENHTLLYQCTLHSVKSKTVDMTITDFSFLPRPDGSIVILYYIEDTNYSRNKGYYINLHHISPEGKELFRQYWENPTFLGHDIVGDDLVFFTNTYTNTESFSTFTTDITLIDMADDFSQHQLDFGDNGVHDCYLQADGSFTTVMTDGSIQTPLETEYGLTQTGSLSYDHLIRNAIATGSKQHLICLLPENTPDTVVMLHGAHNKESIAIADTGEVILFPSGDRFLTIKYFYTGEKEAPLVTIYDAVSLKQLTQFRLEPALGFSSILGFSADETRIYFDVDGMGYQYDIASHTSSPYTNTDENDQPTGILYSYPLSSWGSEYPLLSIVFCGNQGSQEEQTLMVYQDSQQIDSYVYPCSGEDYIPSDWANWSMGGSGLVVTSTWPWLGGSTPTEIFVYSSQDKQCHRLPNPSTAPGQLQIGVGNVSKTVAIMSMDRILRIYDFDQDQFLQSFSLPVPPQEVSALQFIGDDRYLLVFKKNGSVTVMDISNGTVLKELLLDSAVYSYTESIYEDLEQQKLYLYAADSSFTGYVVEMQTWTVIAEIPGLAAYLPQTDQIIQRDFITDTLLVTPQYDLDELISQAQTLLGTATANALE